MKAILKFTLSVFLIFFIGILAILFLVLPVETRDQINPLIEQENRYFMVTSDGKAYGPKGMERYAYDIEALDEDGEALTIQVTAVENLRHGAYIEVLTKGQHVETWQEVPVANLPVAVQKKLKTIN